MARLGHQMGDELVCALHSSASSVEEERSANDVEQPPHAQYGACRCGVMLSVSFAAIDPHNSSDVGGAWRRRRRHAAAHRLEDRPLAPVACAVWTVRGDAGAAVGALAGGGAAGQLARECARGEAARRTVGARPLAPVARAVQTVRGETTAAPIGGHVIMKLPR